MHLFFFRCSPTDVVGPGSIFAEHGSKYWSSIRSGTFANTSQSSGCLIDPHLWDNRTLRCTVSHRRCKNKKKQKNQILTNCNCKLKEFYNLQRINYRQEFGLHYRCWSSVWYPSSLAPLFSSFRKHSAAIFLRLSSRAKSLERVINFGPFLAARDHIMIRKTIVRRNAQLVIINFISSRFFLNLPMFFFSILEWSFCIRNKSDRIAQI